MKKGAEIILSTVALWTFKNLFHTFPIASDVSVFAKWPAQKILFELRISKVAKQKPKKLRCLTKLHAMHAYLHETKDPKSGPAASPPPAVGGLHFM